VKTYVFIGLFQKNKHLYVVLLKFSDTVKFTTEYVDQNTLLISIRHYLPETQLNLVAKKPPATG
jgi:hypothetical protein